MPGILTAQAIVGLARTGFPVLEASAWADCGLGRLGRLAVVQLLVFGHLHVNLQNPYFSLIME